MEYSNLNNSSFFTPQKKPYIYSPYNNNSEKHNSSIQTLPQGPNQSYLTFFIECFKSSSNTFPIAKLINLNHLSKPLLLNINLLMPLLTLFFFFLIQTIHKHSFTFFFFFSLFISPFFAYFLVNSIILQKQNHISSLNNLTFPLFLSLFYTGLLPLFFLNIMTLLIDINSLVGITSLFLFTIYSAILAGKYITLVISNNEIDFINNDIYIITSIFLVFYMLISLNII